VLLVRRSFHRLVHFVRCRVFGVVQLALSRKLSERSRSLAVVNGKFAVQFGRESGAVFSDKSSGLWAGCLTQRAPDVWESARFTGFFSGFGFFLHLKHCPRPPTRG
jgi:hypothetical protein